ncbi:hypothetical protein REPUB_Repub19eG0024900 [Reevesia pubescens]
MSPETAAAVEGSQDLALIIQMISGYQSHVTAFLKVTFSLAHPVLGFGWGGGVATGGQFGAPTYGLFPQFYQFSCPQAEDIGCDASVLLDDSSTIVCEKSSLPNKNSIRGFEVIDEIKAKLEEACPKLFLELTYLPWQLVASLLLPLSKRSGGSSWELTLGRSDSKTASLSTSNNNIPPPNSTLQNLITLFQRRGLDEVDLVALSGGHSIEVARCVTFKQRRYNQNGNNLPDERH